MTTLDLWIDAQIVTMKENFRIIDEYRHEKDKLIIQLWVLKKHLDSTIDFLERSNKFDPK